MYGIGGEGGQGGSTGGGQAQGVGLPSTTPTMARIQAQGMGAQLQNILSQVELNKAVAKKQMQKRIKSKV